MKADRKVEESEDIRFDLMALRSVGYLVNAWVEVTAASMALFVVGDSGFL